MTGISMIIIWKIVSIFSLNSTVVSYVKDPYFTRQQSGYPKASDLLHERYWRAKNICPPAARFFTSLRMTLALRLRSGTGTGQMVRGMGKRSTCPSTTDTWSGMEKGKRYTDYTD